MHAIAADQHVGWLQIAVHDAALAGLPFAAQAVFAWSTPIDAWSNAVWLQLGC